MKKLCIILAAGAGHQVVHMRDLDQGQLSMYGDK
jgi:hypothetical protein